MSLETLLMVVAVLVAAFVNVILPRIMKQQESGPAGGAEPDVPEAPATVLEPLPPVALPPELAIGRRAPTTAAALAPAALAAARPARRSPVGRLSGLRGGIVLVAVLGPCRAQTPFD